MTNRDDMAAAAPFFVSDKHMTTAEFATRERLATAFAAHRIAAVAAERERVGKRLVELADYANNRAKAARRRVDDGDEERNTAVERALRDAAGELADTALAAEIRSGR